MVNFEKFLFSENLKIKDAEYFTISDFNNDGKPDIIIYFADGRMGVSLNKSQSAGDFIFDNVVYIESYCESISTETKLENDTNNSENIKTAADIKSNVKNNTRSLNKLPVGKLLSKKELSDFLNDSQIRQEKRTKKNNEPETNLPKTKENNSSKMTTEKIQIKPEDIKSADTEIQKISISELPCTQPQESNKNIKEKQEAINQDTKIYEVYILNFSNKSGIATEDIQWLEKGFQELLLFELKTVNKFNVAPLELSAKMNPAGRINSSGACIYGEFTVIDKNIILTAFINYKNSISTLKISEKNDNNGILTLVSKLSLKIEDVLTQKLR